MEDEPDRLPRQAREMISRLAEEAAQLRKYKSNSERQRSRQTSLPQLRPKKIEVRADSLKKLVEKSKEDFFSKRESVSRLRSQSRRREQPLIRQFESQVERIMRSEQKPSMKQSRISSMLHELLTDEQPHLPANLRQIEQYQLEKSRTLKKSRLVEVNVDLTKLSASRVVFDRAGLAPTNEVRAFKLPLVGLDEHPKTNFATYHTKEGDIEMACQTIEEKEDKIRIRFVNGFEKWIKKPAMPRIIHEDSADELNASVENSPFYESIAVSDKLLKPLLKKVRESSRSEYHAYLQEQLRSNYVMSMRHFDYLYRNNKLGGRPRESEIDVRCTPFQKRRQQIERVLLGSQELNFVKQFTLQKTKYFPHIIDLYVSLNRLLQFPHFRGFLLSFRDLITESSSASEKIYHYFFQKKQEFEMVIYELETTVTLMTVEVREDIRNKISVNSRLEALTYEDKLALLIKNITTRVNILIKSHVLQGIILGLRQLAEFYQLSWDNSIIANPNLPEGEVYKWCCQQPHPLKYKPLIELKIQYRRLKKIKRKNIYRYVLELRNNIRQCKPFEEARVFCRPLKEIEEEFELKFAEYLQELTVMENVNGCTNSTTVGFDLSDPSILLYRKRIRQQIGKSYDKVVAVCALLSNFELYLADKSYIDQLLELFERINGCALIRDELRLLREDRSIVAALPNLVYCDMLVLQINDIKDKVTHAIDSNRSRIIRACEHRLSAIYERSHQRLIAVETRIESAYGNLDLFLNFYEFFKDRNIESATNALVAEMLTISTLYDVLVESCARIPAQVTKQYLACQDWLRRMQNARSEAKRKLAAASQLFVSTIQQTKLKIFARLQKMIKDLLEVSKITKLTNYRKTSGMCKGIFEELRELSETADGITEKQKIFGLPLSDFSIFQKEKQQFEKYVRLWDFIEKLKDKENIKKLTVANFSAQDLLMLTREGLEVVHFVKRNTVNKRFLTLTEQVQKELAKLLDHLWLLALVLNPSFSETEWLGLFKQVFPEQDKFPSFYEMTVADFEKTGILEHPKEIHEHYKVVRSEYVLLNHLNFFEFALKHLDFGYCSVEDMEVLLVSDQLLATIARLRDHYIYLLTIYPRHSKVDGMATFLRGIHRALQEVQEVVQLLAELNCILKWYMSRYRQEEYPTLRDTLALVADDLMKKTETVKKFSLFYLYEDRSKVSFADGLKSLQEVRLAVLDSFQPLRQKYSFLERLDSGQVYQLLAAMDSSETMEVMLKRYLLPNLKKIGLEVRMVDVKLGTVETFHDEEVEFELTFPKHQPPEHEPIYLAVFQIYDCVSRQLARAIKSETLTSLMRLHCHQLDVAAIYEYYATSHAPLQSVLIAMLLQFHMTLLCICQSRSDLKDYREWLGQRLLSKSIPAEPIRKAALDLIMAMVEYFVDVLLHLESNCGPRVSSFHFLSLPKMLPFFNDRAQLSGQLIRQLEEWTASVKANLEEDTYLFSRVTQSPVYKYMGLKLLDKYTHESQLGSDQRKLLKLDTLVDHGQLRFGLEAYGWLMQYGYQLQQVTIPSMLDHQPLSEAVVCTSNQTILLSHARVNEFMLGRNVVQLDGSALGDPTGIVSHLSRSEQVLLKIRIDRLQLSTLLSMCPLVANLRACLVIECSVSQAALSNLPEPVISCFRVIPQRPAGLPPIPGTQLSWQLKGVAQSILWKPSSSETDRLKNAFAQPLRYHYLTTGVAWHNGLQLQCLNEQLFATNSTEYIRALANLKSISMLNKPISLIFLPLYEYSLEELLGVFVEEEYQKRVADKKKVCSVRQRVWRKGLLEKLLDDLEQYIASGVSSLHYTSLFPSERIGNQPEKERAQTINDWYVLDLSLWQPNSPSYMSLIDWFVGCIGNKCFTFQSGRSHRLNIGTFKLVLKLPSICHLPVSIASIPCVLSFKDPSTINIERQMALWSHSMATTNPQFSPYCAQLVPLIQGIFTETKGIFGSDLNQHSTLTFQQMFLTFTKLLSICLNELRKFMLSHGFYNFTELTDEEKRNVLSPVDLRGTSSIKDDIEHLHEISRQEKDLDTYRRALVKDIGTFMAANLSEQAKEQAKPPSKKLVRQLHSLQSIAVFSFYWAFCGLSNTKHSPTEAALLNSMIAVLQKHSSLSGMSEYAFNLRQLVSLHGVDSLNLRNFWYSLNRECWVTWREVALPTIESVSSSFTDRILEPREIIRLSPHASSIDYISSQLQYFNDSNPFFVSAGSYVASGTEYLTTMLMAYSIPVQLLTDHQSQTANRFSQHLKQTVLSHSPNRLVVLNGTAGISELPDYLAGKSCPPLGARFSKFKGKNELKVSNRLLVIVEDIESPAEQQTPSLSGFIKSLAAYKRYRGTTVYNSSLLLIASDVFSAEEMTYARYQDSETASLLSIYQTASEAFKPNQTEIFNYLCCNPQARMLVDSLKLYPLFRTQPAAALQHYNQTVNQSGVFQTIEQPDLKKKVEQKVKLQIEYYRFLKGEAVKNFGKEEKPFEEQRLDREKELLEIEKEIQCLYEEKTLVQSTNPQSRLVVPKYLLERAEQPRRQPGQKKKEKAPYNEFVVVQDEQQLKWLQAVVQTHIALHYKNQFVRHRILQRLSEQIIADILYVLGCLEVRAGSRHFCMSSNYDSEYCLFVFRIAFMLKEKAAEVSIGRKQVRLLVTEEDAVSTTTLRLRIPEERSQWHQSVNKIIQSLYSTAAKDSYSRSVLLALDLGQSASGFMAYLQAMLEDSRLIDRLIPSASIDRSLLAGKYRGFESIYRAHIIAQLKQRCYICYLVEKEWVRPHQTEPRNVVDLSFPLSSPQLQTKWPSIANPFDSHATIFASAYVVYRKYFRKQFVTYPQLYRRLISAGDAQQLFSTVTHQLLQLYLTRENELITQGGFLHDLDSEFTKKITAIDTTLSSLEQDLNAKYESLLQLEEQSRFCVATIKSSSSSLQDLKQSLETSQFIRYNTERQRMGYDGQECYFAARDQFRQLNRKQLEKEVTKQQFYSCPLMLFYVYWCNVLTDNNFFNEKYSELLEGNIEDAVNEEMKRQFIKAIAYGRVFIVIDTDAMDKLSVQQVAMARRLRKHFRQLLEIDEQAKSRNKGRVYGHDNRYLLREEIAEQLRLIRQQKLNQLQLGFALFMAHCFNYKWDSSKMEYRINEHRKSIQTSTEKLKLAKQSAKQARVQLDRLQEKIKQLKSRITDVENELQTSRSNATLLRDVRQQNMRVLRPVYLFESTYVYSDETTRKYQALLLTFVVTLTVSGWSDFMTDELYTLLRAELPREEQPYLELAIEWVEGKRFIKLLTESELKQLIECTEMYNQRCFWNLVYCQLLRDCQFPDVGYDSTVGVRCGSHWLRMVSMEPSVPELLLSSFQGKVPGLYLQVIDHMRQWSHLNSKKYQQIVDRVQAVSLRADSIEALRAISVQSSKPPFAELLQIDIRPLCKKYEQISQSLKLYPGKHLSRLLQYTVQLCKDNFVGPGSASFHSDFLRIFNQVHFEFSCSQEYQLGVVRKWLGGRALPEPAQQTNIFASRRRPDEHKKLISDYDLLNETARKYETEIEERKGSVGSLEVPLMNSSSTLYKKQFAKRFEYMQDAINESREPLSIHEFAKRPDCQILRMKPSQTEVVCDSSLTGSLIGNKWFQPLVKSALGLNEQQPAREVQPKSEQIGTLQRYFPSELLRVAMRCHPWQLINHRAGLATVLRLQTPILCIASEGYSLTQAVVEWRLAAQTIKVVNMEFTTDKSIYKSKLDSLTDSEVLVVRCVDHFREAFELLESILAQLRSAGRLRVLFLLFGDYEAFKQLPSPVPVYYIKYPKNIKSELIQLNQRLYCSLMSEVETQEGDSNVHEHCLGEYKPTDRKHPKSPCLYWLQPTKYSKYLQIKLQLFYLLFKRRYESFYGIDQDRLIWRLRTQFSHILQVISSSGISVPQLVCNLLDRPDLLPVATELAELVTFTVDNVIYELSDSTQPLIGMLLGHDNFLSLLAMLPDSDPRELLLLSELHQIQQRARQTQQLMLQYRFEQNADKLADRLAHLRKEPPEHLTFHEIQPQFATSQPEVSQVKQQYDQLRQYFAGLVLNSLRVQLPEDQPHSWKKRGGTNRSVLNISELTRKEVEVEALSHPESYSILFKLMKFVKKILSKRAKAGALGGTTNSQGRSSATVANVKLKDVVATQLYSQLTAAIRIFNENRHPSNSKELQKLKGNTLKGAYVKRLYEQYLSDQMPGALDLSLLVEPATVFSSMLLPKAVTFKKPPASFRMMATTQQLDNKDAIPIGGLMLRYGRLDLQSLLVRSSQVYNSIGTLYITLAEREQTGTESVMCLHPTNNLEQEYRASHLKDKKSQIKILASERRIARLPFQIDSFKGWFYVETKLEQGYEQFNDVRLEVAM